MGGKPSIRFLFQGQRSNILLCSAYQMGFRPAMLFGGALRSRLEIRRKANHDAQSLENAGLTCGEH